MSYSDAEDRPKIPADIRRRVLVEAGHRCALPTCRHIEVDIHHIVPWATCQKHEYDNLIALCPNDHRRADKGDIDRKALRIYKNSLRFAHDKFSNLEMDMLFELSRLPTGQGLHWPKFNLLLVKRMIDSGYIDVRVNTATSVLIGGMETAPDVLVITPNRLRKNRLFALDGRD